MTTATTINEVKLNEVLDIAIRDIAGGHGGVMVVLGRRLGLYRVLWNAGPLTSAEVAERAGCAERYVREWLNSQVAARYVDYHPESGKYELSAEQALVLADEESTVYMPLAWELTASMWLDEPKIAEAFRTGKGVPWSDHHPRLFEGVAAFYRQGYEAALVQQWLPSLAGVVEKLERGGTVADVGCGFGHSTVIMAKAFPQSRFVGFDTHKDSIEKARRISAETGVTNVEFKASEFRGVEPATFDLICFFDTLHDLGDPLSAVRKVKKALKPDGTVLLVEPFANDHLEDNINIVGRLYYSGSTAICVPHSLSEEPGAALGAQAGEKKLAELFEAAGYSRFRRAAETSFNLVLEARP
jgi:SAM-dependent methyltransferase